jgi:hypothetical protein
MPYRPTNFRLIVVRPYYINESSSHNITITAETRTGNGENEGDKEDTITIKLTTIENNKGNGNIEQANKPIRKRGRRRPRKHVINTSIKENTAYITIKEQADYELLIKLR